MINLKYIVNVTGPIFDRIDGGNLIGEGRWERNVLDALVRDGREVYVVPWKNGGTYTPGQVRVWQSPEPKPKNLKDFCELEDITNTVFISHSPHGYLDIPVKAHRYILHWFNGPDAPADKEFRDFSNQNSGSVVATYSFLTRTNHYLARIDRQNLVHMHGPTVPKIYFDKNNFREEYLLWSSKLLYSWAEDNRMQKFLIKLFTWCCSVMLEDSVLKLVLLFGSAGRYTTQEEVINWFWNNPVSQPLQKMKERIVFLNRIPWYQVQETLSKTRLVITPHILYGGPPYEAAAFGIPIIMSKQNNPFQSSTHISLFSEVLAVDDSYHNNDFFIFLDRLYRDESFYISTGSAYRNFVSENASYKAYLVDLDKLCKDRGWT